jgi:protein TonB
MFDSVLDRAVVAPPRSAAGAAVSTIAHVLAVAGVIHLSAHAVTEKPKKDADITFVAALPPPPPPPPPLGGGAVQPKIEQPKKPIPVKKPDTIVEAKEKAKPEDKVKEEPKEERPQENAQPGGVEGGKEGGVIGGKVGGEVGGDLRGEIGGKLGNPPVERPAPTSAVIPFGAGMVRPTRIAGRDPVYTREAREAHVEGLAIAKCVLRDSGALTDCRLVKGVPFMDRAILDALTTWRFTPVLFQGRAVSVEYVINVRLKLE